ncbi:MAG: DUF2827 family protein [Pseudomonadales bacterium]
MKKLSIAITIRNDKPLAQIIFGNGLSQNVKFLYDLLKIMGHKPFFLVAKEAEDNTITFSNTKYKAYSMANVWAQDIPVDIALEAGVSIHHPQRAKLRDRRGAVIVSVRYGHSMFMDMEQICHKETLSPGLYINKPDALWASPHFENSFSYLETVYDAPVLTAPYIWEPDFVKEPFSSDDLLVVPDVYVMEPNISLLKNALIPMTIIERLFRENPDCFGKATILNGIGFNKQKFFLENLVRNMRSLESKANKVYFSGRYPFDTVFKRRDVLLGNQWGCELNYLYMEAFYRNVPLVHNSEAHKEGGYYYPEFQVDIGKEMLEKALTDKKVDAYHKRCKKVVYRHSIHNPDVKLAYRKLLEQTLALKAS